MGLEDLYDLNAEIFARFDIENSNIPIHEYAQVILKDLIYVTGALIDESILASRLGVDIKSKNWQEVKELFKLAKYQGVFSDGWDRWWMFKINEIFKTDLPQGNDYASLSGLLHEKLRDIPKEGDKIIIGKLRIIVEKVLSNKPEKIRIEKIVI